MELVLGSWNVTWEAAFGIRPSSCWDLCWSCICIYVSFGMRNKCPQSDYSALSFPRWLIEMAEGLTWLQAFSEGFWQHLRVTWSWPRPVSLVEAVILLPFLLFGALAHVIKSAATFCMTYLGQDRNCGSFLYSMMYLLFQDWLLLLPWSGTYRLWYFSHLPLKDFAGCCERLSVPCPWVCTLSAGHVTMCVGNFKCQYCSKILARENTLPSRSTYPLPASLPGEWALLPCLLKQGICPWTSGARTGEDNSWWWETASLCMD